MSSLAEIARESDEAVRAARQRLVAAVREASRNGMTQSQISKETGRSQPEISRLLRFHGTSPLARRLRNSRPEIQRILSEVGGTDIRVFGSVATGREDQDSDVDLLFTMATPLSLMQLSRLEGEISALIGASTDLTPDSALPPHLKERVLEEAVPL
ncbi:nucleotidyltransferase domain-containing protein [Brachybacterium sp. p3-SID1565]|uniref:Nucleotidyltransferase domain-containing protein n=1 Tax=Brachybacterium epidermidis TaxID=2781983 RepID=A0ABR9VYX7_9MICO|nr:MULTISPECIES: nucleotidyltransferase domain-containing protein [unclassified Brachybacterium]MBE9403388.1 nucleotidyltransferase domain-containing protein [Brachybacterium epidermidis]MCT1385956.1 nucleotidyltransferase domain-containing protein [Brachybacterium sp. p3-SID1565]MCT1775591.1 nucleotidyltransferase domain-containing protein [Brachybacterium sp. p3-SID957]